MSVIEYLTWFAIHLGALGLMLLAAGGLGSVFLRKHSFHSALERLVFTITLGLGLWALLIFALGLLGLLYRGVILGMTAASALGTVLYLIRSSRGQWLQGMRSKEGGRRSHKWLMAPLVLVGVSYWGLLLWVTQYPPINWDSTMYHLVLARQYLIEHRLVIHTGITFPALPALNHALFSWAIALKDDVLAQMVEHTFLMLTALGLYAWGKRQSRPAFGLSVAAFWLAHPLILWLGESAYVDVSLAAFAFLGVYALRIFLDERKAVWWYVGIAFLGFAAGVKMPGLAFLALGTAIGFWVFLRDRDDRKIIVKGWLLALLAVTPWYAFIAYHTGNPIWPLFNQYSRGIWGDPSVSAGYGWIMDAGLPKTFLNFVRAPVEVVFQPQLFLADSGRTLFPVIIAWPLAWIIAWRVRSVRWWTLWAFAYTCYWFVSSQQLRFWAPALPIVGLALYESVQWIVERIWKRAAFHHAVWIALTLAAVIYGCSAMIAELQLKGWFPASPEAREEYLSNNFGGYNAVKYVNERAGETDAVYVINASWLNYYFKPRVIDYLGLLQQSNRPTFRWPDDTQWLQKIEAQNVRWIIVNHANPSPNLKIPKQNPVLNPFWPGYLLVYADSQVWVFCQKTAG